MLTRVKLGPLSKWPSKEVNRLARGDEIQLVAGHYRPIRNEAHGAGQL